jgi:DNA-binding NtrC family response regulator
MRARRCYEVARLAPEVSPSKKFCKINCRDCEYYQLVEGQALNVLVITDSNELARSLKRNAENAPFDLEIADCEYVCSSIVAQFRPDFAIVDCSIGRQVSRDITYHLGQDPRVPFVRIVLAGDDKQFPEECEKEVFARIERPFDIKDISECIYDVEKNGRGKQ